MTGYFGDASYWIALCDANDEYHEQATEYSNLLALDQSRIVTTITTTGYVVGLG